MANRRPLVLIGGQVAVLPSADFIDGATKWITGSGVPGAGTGAVGDMYLDTATGNVYGPKSAGWGSVVMTLSGAAGADGSKWFAWYTNGVPPAGTGINGDYFLDTATGDIYGPKSGSSWPASTAGNIRGPAGAAGAPGASGAMWRAWYANGAPASNVGVNGDMFLDTATGNVYGPKSNGTWPGSPTGNIKGPQGTAISQVSLDFGSTPIGSKSFTFTATGAGVGQRVIMTAASEVLGDELEMDGFSVAAHVSATNTVVAFIVAYPGPVKGARTFNYTIG